MIQECFATAEIQISPSFFNGSELICGKAMTEHKIPGGQNCPAGHSWVKFTSQESKMNDTPGSVERVQKMYLQFWDILLSKKRPIYPILPYSYLQKQRKFGRYGDW